MVNNKYASGANFERKIIKELVNLGCPIVMRGAGSKSYGRIKADIIAICPNHKVLIIQAKHSNKVDIEERDDFNRNIYNLNYKDKRIIGWWADSKYYDKDILEISELIKDKYHNYPGFDEE